VIAPIVFAVAFLLCVFWLIYAVVREHAGHAAGATVGLMFFLLCLAQSVVSK
jgi:hypothetical protein